MIERNKAKYFYYDARHTVEYPIEIHQVTANYISNCKIERSSINARKITKHDTTEEIIHLIFEELQNKASREKDIPLDDFEKEFLGYAKSSEYELEYLESYGGIFNNIIQKISLPLENILLTADLSDDQKLQTLIYIKYKIKCLTVNDSAKHILISAIEGIYNYYNIEIQFKNCFVNTAEYQPLYKLLIESDVLNGKDPLHTNNSRFVYEKEPGDLYVCSKILLNLMSHTISGEKITTDYII